MKLFTPKTILLPTWQGWCLLFLLIAGCIFAVITKVHDFLAVTDRVAIADILVIEDWVPEKVVVAAVKEFKEGGYRFIVVTGLKRFYGGKGGGDDLPPATASRLIESFSIPADRLIVCLGSMTDNHRSFSMASALRDAVRQKVVTTQGFNIVAPAAHARKTWLVYSRALRSEAPVGIIAVPTGDYDPTHWWRSSQGAKWVIANGAGWLHELIVGNK